MAKTGETLPADRESIISDETKEQIKEVLQQAGGEIREKLTEKAIEVIENLIAKLEEILANLQPHPEPVAQEASRRLQGLIAQLKKVKDAKVA